MTEKEALKMARRKGVTLWRVPLELRTEKMCLEAVRRDGVALYWVSEEPRDHVRASVEKGGEAWGF